MVGLQNNGRVVVITLATLVLLDFTGTCLGIMLASLFPSLQVALAGLPLFTLPMILFSGFFLNTASIPVWLNWLSYLRSGAQRDRLTERTQPRCWEELAPRTRACYCFSVRSLTLSSFLCLCLALLPQPDEVWPRRLREESVSRSHVQLRQRQH